MQAKQVPKLKLLKIHESGVNLALKAGVKMAFLVSIWLQVGVKKSP